MPAAKARQSRPRPPLNATAGACASEESQRKEVTHLSGGLCGRQTLTIINESERSYARQDRRDTCVRQVEREAHQDLCRSVSERGVPMSAWGLRGSSRE